MNTLIPESVLPLCKMGQGAECCAFLCFGAGGFCCAKRSGIEGIIRQRLAAGTINAKGDNCSGPPAFVPNLS